MGIEIDFPDLHLYTDLPNKIELLRQSRKVRTRTDLRREFELESWDNLLKLFQSKNFESYDEFMRTIFPVSKNQVYVDRKRFFLSSSYATQILQQELMTKVVRENSFGFSRIVELGAGYGSKLIHLRQSGLFPSESLVAGELMKSGRVLADELSMSFNLGLESMPVDLEEIELLPAADIEKTVFFTSFSLMYLTGRPVSFFEKLMALGARRIIHFEPIYQDYDIDSSWGRDCAAWHEINGYSTEILPGLVLAAEKNPKYRYSNTYLYVSEPTPSCLIAC